MRRCVIVHPESRHEEILPSFVRACNDAGYRPTVITHAANPLARGDVFEEVEGLDMELRFAPDPGREDLADFAKSGRLLLNNEVLSAEISETVDADEYDFVILTSFNRKASAEWARARRKPTLVVVHNVAQVMEDALFSGSLETGHVGFVALGHHVAAELVARLGKRWIDHVGVVHFCFGSGRDPEPVWSDGRRNVLVPGAVNARTRDFSGLVDVLKSDSGPLRDALSVTVSSGGPDRDALETAVREAGLQETFSFVPRGDSGQVAFADYYKALGQAQFLHPLVPSDISRYQKIKITSTIPTSMAFALPCVLDRWTANIYRTPAIVADNDLALSLQALVACSKAEWQEYVASLRVYRRQALRDNAFEVQRLVGFLSGQSDTGAGRPIAQPQAQTANRPASPALATAGPGESNGARDGRDVPTRKIFLIGYNKCGTRTFHDFFTQNNIASIHFKRGNLARRLQANLAAGLAPLNGIDKWTCYSDIQMVSGQEVIEGCERYRDLARYYPQSYFVLQTRDKDRWIQSRLRHGNRGFYAERYRKGMGFATIDETVAHWSESWDRHHREVPEFFAEAGLPLLIYNIEQDSPGRLVRFLDPDFRTDAGFFAHAGKTPDASRPAVPPSNYEDPR